MKIKFIPQRSEGTLAITVIGDVIIINGQSFDLSGLVAGDKLPPIAVDPDQVVGNIERIDGELHIGILLPYGSDTQIDPMQFIEVDASGVLVIPGHAAVQPQDILPGVVNWADVIPAIPVVVVPQVVTMRQARLALLGAGMLGSVNAAIANLPEPDRSVATIEWEYSQEVHRDRALIQALGPLLGLSNAQLDGLFIVAATL